MTLTVNCVTDSRDYVECNVGVNAGGEPVFLMDVTYEGEDFGVTALSVGDAQRLEKQLTEFVNNEAESYEIYYCAIIKGHQMDCEQVLDRNDLQVMNLEFHKKNTYASINLGKSMAVMLASELTMFLVEVALKDSEEQINAGMRSLHKFMMMPEPHKIAVFAKLTGLLYGMNAYASKKETTQELIDNLHKYLENPEG